MLGQGKDEPTLADREVLVEWLLRQKNGTSRLGQLYPNTLMNRLYHEKRAFCMWWVENYSDAVAEYEKALPFAIEESKIDESKRPVFKVSGGWTLARYFSDINGTGRDDAIAKAEWIIEEAAGKPEHSGIFEDTSENRNLMKRSCRNREDFKLYDII